MNNRGPRIDPWETLYFNVAQSEKNFELYYVIFFNFLSYGSYIGSEPIFRYSSNSIEV